MDEVHVQALNSASAMIDANISEFRINPDDHPDLDNIVVAPCGMYIESFDYQGNHFVIDWDELVGDPDEEEIPHEQVMEELRAYCEELDARAVTQR
jgi:hypothetical protein